MELGEPGELIVAGGWKLLGVGGWELLGEDVPLSGVERILSGVGM